MYMRRNTVDYIDVFPCTQMVPVIWLLLVTVSAEEGWYPARQRLPCDKDPKNEREYWHATAEPPEKTHDRRSPSPRSLT